MEVHVVGFIPPVVGVDGKFNTSGEFGSAERLFKFIQKICGYHIAKVGKKATVIYLRRTE